MEELKAFLTRATVLLDRVEALLPNGGASVMDWSAPAFRWRRDGARGWLQPVHKPHAIRLADLQGIDRQKETLAQNTRQFVERRPCNNALLTGARGTGKSSLIKALLTEYRDQGLRLIEVEKHHLVDLPEIVPLLENRPERFLIYCDDLSFEADDASYKALKVVLDGSVAAPPDNVLIYATSNRRHLMPEYMEENRLAQMVEGELHPSEAIEEKVSLSDRFGIWLSFYPFDQDDYLAIARHWLGHFGVPTADEESWRLPALQFAQLRGRSGRAAWQFARNFAGKGAMSANEGK
jgi:predicted AAA+ superfamily ATPase